MNRIVLVYKSEHETFFVIANLRLRAALAVEPFAHAYSVSQAEENVREKHTVLCCNLP